MFLRRAGCLLVVLRHPTDAAAIATGLVRFLAARIRRTGAIHLRGRVAHLDRLTGEVLRHYSTSAGPDGVFRVACKTRRASRCPACAEIYRADTYQLVRAGLVCGKGVPETVTAHPAAFVTRPPLVDLGTDRVVAGCGTGGGGRDEGAGGGGAGWRR